MLRGFTDRKGVEWRVWEVFPSRSPSPKKSDSLSESRLKDSAYANGWLCFESESEKRRLAPIPAGWDINDLGALEQLWEQAEIVPQRKRRHYPDVA